MQNQSIEDIITFLETLPLDKPSQALLIGSEALKYHPKLAHTYCADWDFLATPSWCLHILKNCKPISACLIKNRFLTIKLNVEFGGFQTKLDIELALSDTTALGILETTQPFKNKIIKTCLNQTPICFDVAPLKILYLLKRSHIYWETTEFHTCMKDISQIQATLTENLKLKTQQSKLFAESILNSQQLALFRQRIQEKKDRDGDPASHITMNKNAEQFLDKEELLAKRYMKHDDIHKIVAFNSEPLYQKILIDSEKALCSQDKFWALSQTEQLQDVQEEAMVLALERFILPGYQKDSQSAYNTALQKICTHVTKGWFRDFAIDHYSEIKKCPKDLVFIANTIRQPITLEESEKGWIRRDDSSADRIYIFDGDKHDIFQGYHIVVHAKHTTGHDSDCHGWVYWYNGFFCVDKNKYSVDDILKICNFTYIFQIDEYDYDGRIQFNNLIHPLMNESDNWVTTEITAYMFTSYSNTINDNRYYENVDQCNIQKCSDIMDIIYDICPEALEFVNDMRKHDDGTYENSFLDIIQNKMNELENTY